MAYVYIYIYIYMTIYVLSIYISIENKNRFRMSYTLQGPVKPVDPVRISLKTITEPSESSKSPVSVRCLKNIAIHLESH